MTLLDGDNADDPGLTIRCEEHASVGVTFGGRFSFDEDSVHYAVDVWAPGLTARADEVVAWIWDSDPRLAADVRGFLVGEQR
ncbi:hypothetical protein A6A06_06015 [Streptomyces sp. CB02923]|nr:hypothetical protein A6A06_06015 [Streptomyces sp. CB02923]